jgi:hypothetical protein
VKLYEHAKLLARFHLVEGVGGKLPSQNTQLPCPPPPDRRKERKKKEEKEREREREKGRERGVYIFGATYLIIISVTSQGFIQKKKFWRGRGCGSFTHLVPLPPPQITELGVLGVAIL